ncbi:hypothetical protein [Sphingobium phenoxybenzoativorans]|nr:hypothetical protein [Sphingobium phenoxybenzoativorans]
MLRDERTLYQAPLVAASCVAYDDPQHEQRQRAKIFALASGKIMI